jgi:hypothetical protein
VIGRNIRTDTHPDAKEFSASIKARGVLEVITAYRDEEGSMVVLRGQRRTLVAAQVGTPSGTVTVRVVPAPEEADRIIDQMDTSSNSSYPSWVRPAARPERPHPRQSSPIRQTDRTESTVGCANHPKVTRMTATTRAVRGS